MNTAAAAASSVDAYMYVRTFMYVYNALLYMYCMLSGPQNQHLVYKPAQYIMQMFIF